MLSIFCLLLGLYLSASTSSMTISNSLIHFLEAHSWKELQFGLGSRCDLEKSFGHSWSSSFDSSKVHICWCFLASLIVSEAVRLVILDFWLFWEGWLCQISLRLPLWTLLCSNTFIVPSSGLTLCFVTFSSPSSGTTLCFGTSSV